MTSKIHKGIHTVENMGKLASIPFRATEERREQLKISAAKRHQSIQELLEQGLVLALGEGGDDPAPPPSHVAVMVPKGLAKRVQRFTELLIKASKSEALKKIVADAENLLVTVAEHTIENIATTKRVANGE